MSLNILVAEKDKNNLKFILNTLKNQESVNLYSTFQTFSEVIRIIEQKKIDMVFIDTGILRSHVYSCIKIIFKRFSGIKIVLVSNSMEYLSLAFDTMAVGYIIKPVSSNAVSKCVQRAKNWNSMLKTSKLIVQHKGKTIFINFNDILFIEANNRKCIIHTLKDEYAVYKSIKNIINELPPEIFLLSHRSYIINTEKIKHIEQFNKNSYNVTFSENENKIALLSRRRLKSLKLKCSGQGELPINLRT